MLSTFSTILASAAEAGNESIVQMFGIQWQKLIAQVISFGIVYAVLKRFAFGPIMAVLEERRSRIAESEENLEKTRKNLASAESKAAEIIAAANSEADRLVKEAREAAGAAGEKKTQEAISEAAQIIAKAREASAQEHARLLAELKRDFSRLVVSATGKVTGKVLGNEDHERINQEALSQMSLN